MVKEEEEEEEKEVAYEGEAAAARAVTSIAILAPRNGRVGYARRGQCVPQWMRPSHIPCRPRPRRAFAKARDSSPFSSPPPGRARAKVQVRGKRAAPLECVYRDIFFFLHRWHNWILIRESITSLATLNFARVEGYVERRGLISISRPV